MLPCQPPSVIPKMEYEKWNLQYSHAYRSSKNTDIGIAEKLRVTYTESNKMHLDLILFRHIIYIYHELQSQE